MNDQKKLIEEEAEKQVPIEDMYAFKKGANFALGLKDEWISVENEMPEYDIPVLWIQEDGFMWIEDLDDDGNSWDLKANDADEIFERPKPTHWQPLPNPPKINTP